MAGFYRVWTKDGEKVNQLERMKVFNEQIDTAFENSSNTSDNEGRHIGEVQKMNEYSCRVLSFCQLLEGV